MKQSKRNIANATAKAERKAKGKPPVSRFAAKREAQIKAAKGAGQ